MITTLTNKYPLRPWIVGFNCSLHKRNKLRITASDFEDSLDGLLAGLSFKRKLGCTNYIARIDKHIIQTTLSAGEKK